VSVPVAAGEAPLRPYIAAGLVLAAILVVSYIAIRGVRKRRWPDVGHLFKLVLTTTAITNGVRMGIIAVTATNVAPFTDEDRFFIPLAGFALIIVSVREVYEVFAESTK
jgi:hypothetical protein